MSTDILSTEQIAALSIDELKANFFELMNAIVTTYGDDENKEDNDDEQ